MLRLTHVTLKTRQVILQDVDFTFEKGRIYGILAINGSGKTTLFRAISNLIPISSGNIAVSILCFIMRVLNGWMGTSVGWTIFVL